MSQKHKLKVFQSTFLPVLTYGLDAVTITEKQLHRLDAHYIRFLRRIVGIKASYYSHVPDQEVYKKAQYPKLPSDVIVDLQFKMLHVKRILPANHRTQILNMRCGRDRRSILKVQSRLVLFVVN